MPFRKLLTIATRTQVMKEIDAELAALRLLNADMAAMLKKLEFKGHDYDSESGEEIEDYRCLVCGWGMTHAPDCSLAALLRRCEKG